MQSRTLKRENTHSDCRVETLNVPTGARRSPTATAKANKLKEEIKAEGFGEVESGHCEHRAGTAERNTCYVLCRSSSAPHNAQCKRLFALGYSPDRTHRISFYMYAMRVALSLFLALFYFFFCDRIWATGTAKVWSMLQRFRARAHCHSIGNNNHSSCSNYRTRRSRIPSDMCLICTFVALERTCASKKNLKFSASRIDVDTSHMEGRMRSSDGAQMLDAISKMFKLIPTNSVRLTWTLLFPEHPHVPKELFIWVSIARKYRENLAETSSGKSSADPLKRPSELLPQQERIISNVCSNRKPYSALDVSAESSQRNKKSALSLECIILGVLQNEKSLEYAAAMSSRSNSRDWAK